MKQENGAGRVWDAPFLFGVLLPILAVLLDPYVFQGEGVFSKWMGAAYGLTAIGVLSMCYWLLSRASSSFLAGIFAACSFLAFVIGVLILPLSVIGILLFGIGLLGLIPFATSYVFYKSVSVVWDASNTKNKISQFSTGIFLVLLVVVTCQATVKYVNAKAIMVIASHGLLVSSADKLVLLTAEPLGLRKNLVDVWRKEDDSKRAMNLSRAYKDRYGTQIDVDEALFFD